MINKKIINLVLFVWTCLLLVYRLLICFSYRFELCNGEVNNIWKILNVSDGQSMYNNPEKLPLDIFQYTPFSQIPIIIINTFISKNNINYVYLTTVTGRIYELLVNVLTIVLIYKIAKKYFKISSSFSIAIALLIASNFPQTNFSVRPDSTLLFFLILTVYYYLSILNNYSFKNIILLSVLFSLCFLTKQDGIIISVPIAIHLLYKKKTLFLFKLILFSLILLPLSIIICQIYFGEYFFLSIFNGINNPSSIQQSISVFLRSFEFYFHVFLISLPLFFLHLYTTKETNRKFLLFLSLFYLIFAFFTTMKNGSWINYYLSSIVFLILTTFVVIKPQLRNTIFVLLFLGTICFNLNQIYNYTYPYVKRGDEKSEYYKISKSILEIKRKYNIKKDVKVLNIGLIERNLLFKNTIMINTEYYVNSKFNYSNFTQKDKSKIKYIIYNYKKEDIIYLKYLFSYFKIDIDNFVKSKYDNYCILTRKGS
jgi:hypothetical protein